MEPGALRSDALTASRRKVGQSVSGEYAVSKMQKQKPSRDDVERSEWKGADYAQIGLAFIISELSCRGRSLKGSCDIPNLTIEEVKWSSGANGS